MIITSGKYKGQKIAVPDEKITRPTLSKVRMSIFNTLQSILDFENKTFLDKLAEYKNLHILDGEDTDEELHNINPVQYDAYIYWWFNIYGGRKSI